MDKKIIDNIVWWIPIKKLRDNVRQYLQFNFDLQNSISEINNNIINIQTDINNMNYILKNSRSSYNLIYTALHYNKETFEQYKNINKNKEIVLLASGPTLNDFIPLNNKLYVGVNKTIFYKNIKLDYFFMQDTIYGQYNDILEYLSMNKPDNLDIFFGILDHTFMKTQISEQYAIDINAKRYVVWHGKYEDSIVYDITSCPLGNFWSVIFPALQFIFWTNPKRIYLVGCDASNNGYYNSNIKSNLYIPAILTGWEKIKEFKNIYYPNTEIISINPIGLKGLFDKDIYTKDGVYIDENCNEINIM